jgi:formylglycine-generating enzyme required for sulfatase activity
MAAAGVGLGLVAAAALLSAPPILAGVAFAVLLAAAAWLAWSGEAVAVPVPAAGAPGGTADDSGSGQAERLGGESEPAPRPVAPTLELVRIPAGSFPMGSPEDEEGRFEHEGPLHTVEVSAFRCMRYPVTRSLYSEVMGKDPGWPEGEADDRPVNNVSWHDAVAFCNRLSEREGLKPCYRIAGEQATWDRQATGFRLPTEAEWEYACRAGTSSRWSWGDDPEEARHHAWFGENSDGHPHPVGRKKPNLWGLHDVHGSVWEWCWDWFAPYRAQAEEDPIGPESGLGRVVRGGSFANTPRILRSAYRNWVVPESRNRNFGFRCVRGPRRQP